MESVNIGIIGLGNIGRGTVSILQKNEELITDRLGVPVKIVRVADLDPSTPGKASLPGEIFTTDAAIVLNDSDVQIVVELIGGIEPAKSFILEAMNNGKHVITANKALLSTHWAELVQSAAECGVSLLFEGSVAGGIPLIRTIKVDLVGNRIRSVTGIINGTCNYILSSMQAQGRSFGDVLAEAQEKGYAEADPAMDIEGTDAAQKLSILVNLCFNVPITYSDLPYQGIGMLMPLDLEMADEFGYSVKLLASAKRVDGQVEAWVHPSLVPRSHPLAFVDGVYNAVYIEDDNLGSSLYYGRGAGALPTGSAVVADIVSVARDMLSGAEGRVPVSGLHPAGTSKENLELAGDAVSEFYVRVSANDQPGVLSSVSGILGKNNISISSVIQRGREAVDGSGVPLVMILHEARYSRMLSALEEIDALDVVLDRSFLMRILPEGEQS